MKTITSLKNNVIVEAKALQSAKARQEQHCFLVDGEHMVSEAFAWMPEKIHRVFIDENELERFSKLIENPAFSGDVFLVPAHVMQAISQVKTSQGIAAVCAIPDSAKPDLLGERLVLLENVQDPGNVGTIFRTIDAVGFHGIILTPGCADPLGPKALRATMGSVYRIPVCFVPDAKTALNFLNDRGYATIAAALDGEPFYQRGILPEKICVCIGNEGNGLRPDTIEECRFHYRLPMRGNAESLNAAVACAVMMYDLMRQEPE